MVRRSNLLAAALALVVGAAAPAAHAAAASFKLDIHFSTTPAKLSTNATPSFTLTRNVHYGVKSQTCRLDNAAWKACGPTAWKPGHVADGVHTAQVKLVMKDGRSAGSSYTWRIDTTAPHAPTIFGVGTSLIWSHEAAHQIGGTASDPNGSGIAHYAYRLNGGAEQTMAAGGSFDITAAGVTGISMVAVDRAGNRSVASTAQWGLDRTVPQIDTSAVPAWSSQIQINLPDLISEQGGSGLAGALWKVRPAGGDDDSWSLVHQVGTDPVITAPGDGAWEFMLRAWDGANNVTDVYITVNQSAAPPAPTAPVITGGLGLATPDYRTQMEFHIGLSSDAGGPATKYEVLLLRDGHQNIDVVYNAGDLGADDQTFGIYPLHCGEVVELQVRALGNFGMWSDWSAPTDGSTVLFGC